MPYLEREKVKGIVLASPETKQEAFSIELLQFEEDSFDGSESIDFGYYYNGEPLGGAFLSHFPQERRLVWRTFYPLSNVSDLDILMVYGRGVGTLAMAHTLVYMVEVFPQIDADYTIQHSSNPSPDRKIQLEKMGIAYETPHQLGEYMQKTLDYAESKGFHFKNPFHVS